GQVYNRVEHTLVLADLHHQGVEEDDWINVVQRSGLPCLDLIHYGVGDVRDQGRRNIRAVDVLQLALDVADRHAPSVHRQDLVIKPLQAGLTLWYYLWFEFTIPVARNSETEFSLVAEHSLLAVAVSAILTALAGALALLIAQVIVHLGFQAALDKGLREL